MNCWKTVNMNKEYGQERIYFVSMLVGLLMFMLLYVPISIFHHYALADDDAFLPFAVALLLLPTIHSSLHVLSCLVLGRSIRIIPKRKFQVIPMFYFCTKSHESKMMSVLIAMAPTIFLTLPGLAASFMFKDVYVFILILTAANIGLSLKDFIYAAHLLRAPKRCRISNRVSSLDILIHPEQNR